ncbi:MAG: FixH family protein [Armatimonadetes bacterium]|nr:FixH family protein [Armatimonadota bacterium]
MTRAVPAAVAGLIALAALAAAGCGGSTVAMEARQGGLVARLELEPAPPPAMQPVKMAVSLVRSDGSPVERARVALRLRMPDMDHGAAAVTLEPRGRGRYEGTGTFEMAGAWEITLSASAESDLVERFRVVVKP